MQLRQCYRLMKTFFKSFPKNPEKQALGIENLIGFGGWLLNFYTMLSYRNKKIITAKLHFGANFALPMQLSADLQIPRQLAEIN